MMTLKNLFVGSQKDDRRRNQDVSEIKSRYPLDTRDREDLEKYIEGSISGLAFTKR